MLHWHGDTFGLPPGATLLASTEVYEHQAFAWGRNALALQFHAEVTAQGLERWFIGHACELAGSSDVAPSRLRGDSARWCPILEPRGRQCFEAWLRHGDPR